MPDGGRISPASMPARSSSRENQRASDSSSPSTVMPVPSGCARPRKPSIRLDGNGQGWLATYSTSATRTPASSSTSRPTACSIDSPGSTKPASVDQRPSGHSAWRPSRQRSSLSVISMITAGSVRG